MKEQYENILDFAKKNVPFEDWRSSIKSSLTGEKRRGGLSGGLKVIQDIRIIGEKKVNIDLIFRENSIIEGNIDVNVDEIVSFIWNKIFSTSAFNKFLTEIELGYDSELQIRHFVPVEEGINTSYVIILLHKDYSKPEPLRFTLSSKLKFEIVKELYPKKPDFENILNLSKEINISKKSSVLNFVIDKDIFSQAITSNVFQIVIFRYPDLDYLASTPSIGVGVGVNSQKSTSSVGVIAKDQNGNIGCTTCYHDFAKLSNFKIGQSIYINGHQATVNSIDILSDSCFATFSNSTNIPLSTPNNGPLIGVSPRAGQICDFVGITSGVSQATVTSWDPSIPYIKPQSGLINMHKVYSTPSVNPGDSGSALIDAQGNIIGFAAFRTGVGFPIPFAAWIWAENVFFAHSIS